MQDPVNITVGATLRNGQRVEIRSQRPQDRKDLEAALARMSDESLHSRFFGAKRYFSEKEAERFLDIDFVNHVALVAVVDEDNKPAIIGAGRYVVVQPGQAEVAFGVVDQYQGQGLGGALLRELTGVARHAGIKELIAEVLGSNLAMLKVFEKSGLQMKKTREGPVVHVALKLEQ
jgi:RimJ/RimL family protein N-acetyltransferase